MNEVENNIEKQLVLTEEIKDYILETAKWSKYLSILGFVFLGNIFILGLLIIFSIGTHFLVEYTGLYFYPDYPPGMFLTSGFIYIGVSLLYIFPFYHLYSFTSKIKNAIFCSDNQLLTEGFAKLKLHYKFVGIFTFMIVVFYAFIIFIGFVILQLNRINY